MNDTWIEYSRENVDTIRNTYLVICCHEEWLDYLNLHETSWMLFARTDGYIKEFGWPSTG